MKKADRVKTVYGKGTVLATHGGVTHVQLDGQVIPFCTNEVVVIDSEEETRNED